jgi:hypothetical protein
MTSEVGPRVGWSILHPRAPESMLQQGHARTGEGRNTDFPYPRRNALRPPMGVQACSSPDKAPGWPCFSQQPCAPLRRAGQLRRASPTLAAAPRQLRPPSSPAPAPSHQPCACALPAALRQAARPMPTCRGASAASASPAR